MAKQATIVEGVSGTAEAFMLGQAAPEPLPAHVSLAVRELMQKVATFVGPARIEWVHDESTAWLVQLHKGATTTSGNVLYPGKPTREHEFRVEAGIEELRKLVERLRGTSDGVILVGEVGVTSHFGDVLRAAQIPSRIKPRRTGYEAQRLFTRAY